MPSPPAPGDWAPYINAIATSSAVLLSAFVAIVLAVSQVLTARGIARMRATLDLIEKAESSNHYIRITSVFSRYRRADAFLDLIEPTDDLRPDRFAVLGYLNHYETIALFIRKKVLDGPTYRAWIMGTLVRDWNAAAAFVQRERWGWDPVARHWVYDPTLLRELQSLACAWSSTAVRLTAASSDQPLELPGPEDDLLPTLDGGDRDSVENPNP